MAYLVSDNYRFKVTEQVIFIWNHCAMEMSYVENYWRKYIEHTHG